LQSGILPVPEVAVLNATIFFVILVMDAIQFVMRIMMILTGHASRMFLPMGVGNFLMELLMPAAISYVLANFSRIVVAPILKLRELVRPVAAVVSTSMFIMVLVMNVGQFIVRIVMVRAVSHSFGVFLGMSTC
jgi:hypothetical protein